MSRTKQKELRTSTGNESYLALERGRRQSQRAWDGIVLAATFSRNTRHLVCSNDISNEVKLTGDTGVVGEKVLWKVILVVVLR